MEAQKAVEKKNDKIQLIIKWGIAIGVPALLYFLIPDMDGISLEMRKFFVCTAWAILTWAMNLLPVYISGLLLTVGAILWGVAPANVVLGPWTGSIVWLSLGGLTLSVIFEKSGLMERIAYFFIVKSGGSYKGIVTGLVLSGAIVGLLVPNMTGRVALYCALCYGIYNALKIPKNSSAGAGIMFAGFVAAIAPSWMYLSASENLQLVNSYLKDAGESVTWMKYFVSNFPVMLIWLIVLLVMVRVLFKQDAPIDGKEYFEKKQKELGPMTAKEIKFLIILLALVIAIVFVNVDAGWLFTLAVIVCFIPGIDVADVKDLQKVNFPMVFFVAATMSIGSMSNAVGVAGLASELLMPVLQNVGNFGLVVFSWLTGVLVDMLMTPLAGMASFSPLFIEIAQKLGLSATGVTFSFVWGVEQLFFPYEWALFLILFSYDVFDTKKAIKFCTVRTILSLIFLVVLIYPYWMLTGFLK